MNGRSVFLLPVTLEHLRVRPGPPSAHLESGVCWQHCLCRLVLLPSSHLTKDYNTDEIRPWKRRGVFMKVQSAALNRFAKVQSPNFCVGAQWRLAVKDWAASQKDWECHCFRICPCTSLSPYSTLKKPDPKIVSEVFWVWSLQNRWPRTWSVDVKLWALKWPLSYVIEWASKCTFICLKLKLFWGTLPCVHSDN